MLAEKFFLVLETLRSHAAGDDPGIVTSPLVTSPARPAPAPEVAKGSPRKVPVPDDRG
ncbi:hypothetical protein FBZ94_108289 [Bradyrhizobium sacchari]|uniref:Uncharacterized protein n=1 Tax=Bradyrhizobium sacchari TaxID=1399419 RepID=A0A560KCX4_9BRAD|nr:hypothetical protein FBZ94_108289 [Bradyrhizobium sacchari]TWB78450.1 hypothetical protein FBZ95_103289 [Bradyrhizobium sacchari]